MRYESSCPHCLQAVTAESDFAGSTVRCPHCQGEFALSPPGLEAVSSREPLPPGARIPAGAQHRPAAPAAPNVRRFHFSCPRCASVLEADTSLIGQRSRCPTCATAFTTPTFDPQTGMVGEPGQVSGEPQDPTPVHAYAAAGERAPALVRTADGQMVIRCPRCEGESSIDADRCETCGLPFTLAGVSHDAMPGGTNGYAVASFVMGLLGLPCFVVVVPQVLAIVLGAIALMRIGPAGTERGRGLAWAGIVLGVVSFAVTAAAFTMQ